MGVDALESLLTRFIELKGSDLYLTVGFPPGVRVSDSIVTLSQEPLSDVDIEKLLTELLSKEQLEEFRAQLEFNTAMAWDECTRFRVNVFRQQQHSGAVIRRVQMDIPTVESLGLPAVYNELAMEPRGLVLVVGSTGSGKSTSLAAMIGHRNTHGYGHIVTVEDPIEFIHSHKQCIVTQRDVGVDTSSFGMALKNVLRQRPDVVLIGEIRDRETMEHALHFSETGHLCLATLHGGNTCQALERILHFFPQEKQAQVYYSLAYNLRGILSQRLVITPQGTRVVAAEVMLNRGLIRSLIQESKFKEIPEVMARNRGEGMQTFDQVLYELFVSSHISEEVALLDSDNPANLSLLINQFKNAGKHATGKEPTLKFKPVSSTF